MKKWRVALVLPQARWVLEARLRKLALDAQCFIILHSAFCISELVRLPGVAPGHSPWRGDILLLNHSRSKKLMLDG